MEPNSPEAAGLLTKTTLYIVGWFGTVGALIWNASRKYNGLENRVTALEQNAPVMCSNKQALCRQEMENSIESESHKITSSFNADVADIKQDAALTRQEICHLTEKVDEGFAELKRIVRGTTE